MATKTKDLLDTLGRRGPHGVECGDLGFTGLPGTVHVPVGASSPAPLVAFAHDWTKSPLHYVDTAKHLASWGFVVVMPGTSRGPMVDHHRFADEFSASIENVLASTLGSGTVRADARRIGLAGHGMGAGVAGLLATLRTDIDGVAMLFPAPTEPSAIESAHLADAAALVVSTDGGLHTDLADDLGLTWRGRTVHRRLDKGSESGMVERGPLLGGIGLASGDRRTQRVVRPLLAGFLLATVAGDDAYADFADPEAKVKIPDAPVVTDEQVEKDRESLVDGAPPALTFLKAFAG